MQLGKREREVDVESPAEKAARVHRDRVQDALDVVETELIIGGFKKDVQKHYASNTFYTFVVPGRIRSTYDEQDNIKLCGYNIFSKSLGFSFSAWGRKATDKEVDDWRKAQPVADPRGGYTHKGVHYPAGNCWGPRGFFGPRYGSNFTGD